jgi:hypothetical protein
MTEWIEVVIYEVYSKAMHWTNGLNAVHNKQRMLQFVRIVQKVAFDELLTKQAMRKINYT